MKESKSERHKRKLADAKSLYNFHLEQLAHHSQEMDKCTKLIKQYETNTNHNKSI